MNFNDMHFRNIKGGEGSRGVVTADKECGVALKLLKTDYPSLNTTGRILKKIKKLDLHNIYKIYAILSENNFSLKSIYGYYMKYYEQDKYLIFQPIDYVIKNFKSLKDTFRQLYDHNIEIVDLHGNNAIITKDEIVIIDVDNYTFLNPLTKKIFHKPYKAVALISSIIYEEILMTDSDICALDLHKYMHYNEETFIDDIKDFPTLYDYICYKYDEYMKENKEIVR